MPITDLVAPEAILPALKVNSKKQALQELAAKAAELTGEFYRAMYDRNYFSTTHSASAASFGTTAAGGN